MKKIKVSINRKKNVTLGQDDYLARGGEGEVYVKGDTAYKIYHNPGSVIPERKIDELRVIDNPYVMVPRDILYDCSSGQAVGFTMKYVDNVEYLCRLFVGNYKKANHISALDIVEIVKKMQALLRHIHGKNIVVGDYNEMNVLVDSTFTTPYHIDVDSYQTPGFKATAIMESVRDRKLPMGVFNEMSDWFSWAVVTFQLYTGIHPYKGRHPKYKPGDLDGRMQDCVSVFDKDVRVPKSCSRLSDIPKPHLDWYRSLFVGNQRSVPPFLDRLSTALSAGTSGLNSPAGQPGITSNNGGSGYASPVKLSGIFGGHTYDVTADGVYRDRQKVFGIRDKKTKVLLANVPGEQPVIAVKRSDGVEFSDSNGSPVNRIHARDFIACNGNIYTLNQGYLLENSFIKLGKIKHLTKPVAMVPGIATKLYPGLAVMDVFGRSVLLIPYTAGRCAQVKIPEGDRYRIVDAVRDKTRVTLMAEQRGRFDRFRFIFDPTFSRYTVSVDHDVDVKELNR